MKLYLSLSRRLNVKENLSPGEKILIKSKQINSYNSEI